MERSQLGGAQASFGRALEACFNVPPEPSWGLKSRLQVPWGLSRIRFSRASCFPEQNLEKQHVEIEDIWPSARGVRYWVCSLKPGLGLCTLSSKSWHIPALCHCQDSEMDVKTGKKSNKLSLKAT